MSSLFSGLKTIKQKSAPEKVETPDAAPKGFNSATAHGLYDPKQSSSSASIPAASEKIATVGDGGASWKRRALLRCKQKADMSGKSLTEVVTEMHGSTVQQMANESKGGYERWNGSRKSYKPKEDGEGGNIRGRETQATPRTDVRGGGMRLGRNSSDADVLKRFKGKVKDGFQRSGLDSKSSSIKPTKESHRHHDSSSKKREREPEYEVWDKSKFEDILKQSEEEEAQRARSRMKTDIWDEEVDVPVRTPHHIHPPKEASSTGGGGGNLSAAAAMRARLSTPKNVPTTSDTSSNLSAAAAMRARLKTPSSSSEPPEPLVQGLAPLDREGRRLLALLEGDKGLDQKEDFRKGKWRGKAKGEASAGGGEEGAKRMDVTAMAAFEREVLVCAMCLIL